MIVRDAFVKNLNRLMVIHGKTQSDVIDDLGIKQNTYSQWMNGKTYPRAEAIQKLADYFDVSISELVGDDKGGSPSGIIRINVYSRLTSRDATREMKNVVGFIEVPSRMAKGNELIALRVNGDHMSPKIEEDDTIIVSLQNKVDNNDIAVLVVGDDEAIVRKVVINEFGMTLVCFNPKYEPIFFSNGEIRIMPVAIVGKVIESRKKF